MEKARRHREVVSSSIPKETIRSGKLGAMTEEMTVLTANRVFAKYSVEVFWCGK